MERELEMSVNKRVMAFIKNKSITIKSLALQIGVNEKTLGNKLVGRIRIDLDTVLALLTTYDSLSAEWEHIQDDTLSGHRVKTGVHYTTVILPQTRKILERYSYHIPKMAYDDYRRILVEMMGVLGINKKISTHNGRHTFATTVALGNGVPIEILKKMMGHKSVKTTERYARVQQPMVEREAERLAQLMGG